MSRSSSTALATGSFDPPLHRSIVELRASLQGFRRDLEALCDARRKNNANRRAFYAIQPDAGRIGSHELQHQKDEPASLDSWRQLAAERQPAVEHSRGNMAANVPSCIPDVALLRNQFKADIRRASEDGSLIAACDIAAEEREARSVHLDETMVDVLTKKNVPTTLMDEMPTASHSMPEVRHSVGIMGTGKLAADSLQAKRKDSKLDKLGGEQFLRDLVVEFLQREAPSKLANITREDLTDIEVDDLSFDKARISALFRANPKPDLRQIHLVLNNGAWCVKSVLHPESGKLDGDACEVGMYEGGEKQPMKLLTPGEHVSGSMDGKEGCLPLKMTIVGAKGLRDADPWPLQGKSDPYCLCEILGKATEKVQTKVVDNNDDPTWDHSAELTGYQPGDVLVFKIYDSDYKRPDDLLGTLNMASDQFFPHGFDGEIPLSETGTPVPAQLRLKIAPFVLPAGYRTPELPPGNAIPTRTGGLSTESTAETALERPPGASQPSSHAKRKAAPSPIDVGDSSSCSVEPGGWGGGSADAGVAGGSLLLSIRHALCNLEAERTPKQVFAKFVGTGDASDSLTMNQQQFHKFVAMYSGRSPAASGGESLSAELFEELAVVDLSGNHCLPYDLFCAEFFSEERAPDSFLRINGKRRALLRGVCRAARKGASSTTSDLHSYINHRVSSVAPSDAALDYRGFSDLIIELLADQESKPDSVALKALWLELVQSQQNSSRLLDTACICKALLDTEAAQQSPVRNTRPSAGLDADFFHLTGSQSAAGHSLAAKQRITATELETSNGTLLEAMRFALSSYVGKPHQLFAEASMESDQDRPLNRQEFTNLAARLGGGSSMNQEDPMDSATSTDSDAHRLFDELAVMDSTGRLTLPYEIFALEVCSEREPDVAAKTSKLGVTLLQNLQAALRSSVPESMERITLLAKQEPLDEVNFQRLLGQLGVTPNPVSVKVLWRSLIRSQKGAEQRVSPHELRERIVACPSPADEDNSELEISLSESLSQSWPVGDGTTIEARKISDKKPEPLRLMIVKARGLQVPNQREPPNAYCKFYVKGAPDSARAQTKVKAFSYVPVWDHEAELPDFLPGNEIVFDLYDRALGKVDDFLGSLVIPSEHFYPGGFEGELPLKDCEEGVNAFLTIRIMQSSPGAQTGDAALQRDLWGAVADRLEGHSLASELRSSDNVQKVPPPTSESAHAEAVLHKPDLQSGGFLVGRGYSGHENRGRSVEQLAPEGETSRGLQPVMLKAEGALVGIGYNSLQIRTRGQDRQHANAKQTPEAQETDVVRTPDTAIVEEVAKETEHHMGLQPVVLKAGGAFVGSGYNGCEIRNHSQDRQQESTTHEAVFCRSCHNTGVDAFGKPCNCSYSKNSRTVIDTTVDTTHEKTRLSPTRCKAAAIVADRLREDDTSFTSKPLQDCNMATRAIAGFMQNSDDEPMTATAGDGADEQLQVEHCKSAAVAIKRVREDDGPFSPKPLQDNNMAKRAVASLLQKSDDESATAG